MVVLPETDVDAAASSAEKLRRLVGSRQVRLEDGHVLTVTLCAGVAGGLGQHLQLDALVRDADAALYTRQGPRPRPGLRLPRDRGRQPHPAGGHRPAGARAGGRGRSGGDGRRDREPHRGARRPAGLGGQAVVDDRRDGGQPGPGPRPAERRARADPTASLLHDLGKLAIPDEILTKPGELTEPEWRVVAEHPKIGQVVLEQAGALRDAATIVLHHHEWFDGRGYPHGLSGQEIPVGARIVAIADAYEAMVAGRPYRRAINHDQAIAELRRHAGIQFDPEIVRLFSILFADGVPWKPDGHGFAHAHPHAGDERSHAQIHDDLHDRRRLAIPADGTEVTINGGGFDVPTGTNG